MAAVQSLNFSELGKNVALTLAQRSEQTHVSGSTGTVLWCNENYSLMGPLAWPLILFTLHHLKKTLLTGVKFLNLFVGLICVSSSNLLPSMAGRVRGEG